MRSVRSASPISEYSYRVPSVANASVTVAVAPTRSRPEYSDRKIAV
ncbi:hypothetical protein [Curtobacterium sp. MCBD17_023]|nr:hypothetical protein [Curtobacterium sp. MCBD17_023]